MTKKNSIGELGDYPNEKYRQFFEKFPEINTLDVNEWKTVHILAYFCKKYEEQYGVKYTFKFNSPSPPKCFEVFQVKRLGILLSSNPLILKQYIDWVFINIVTKAKRRLTSISFMTADEVVNNYKMNILFANKKSIEVNRSSPLPAEYKSVFDASGTNIQTYGDLAFISQMGDMPEALKSALNKIQEMGFDKSILERIV